MSEHDAKEHNTKLEDKRGWRPEERATEYDVRPEEKLAENDAKEQNDAKFEENQTTEQNAESFNPNDPNSITNPNHLQHENWLNDPNHPDDEIWLTAKKAYRVSEAFKRARVETGYVPINLAQDDGPANIANPRNPNHPNHINWVNANEASQTPNNPFHPDHQEWLSDKLKDNADQEPNYAVRFQEKKDWLDKKSPEERGEIFKAKPHLKKIYEVDDTLEKK